MARLDTDLIGLQIVARDRAALVGEIDGLILDDETLEVAGFLVNLGLYEAQVLPFAGAQSVGRDAVIVESADAIAPISSSSRLDALAKREITLTDAAAITLAGKLVGTIGDFYVDTETGDLVGLEFYPSDEEVYTAELVILPASTIHRLGRDIVVLQNDYDQKFLKDVDSLERMDRRSRSRGDEAGGTEAPQSAPPESGGEDAVSATATEVAEPEPVVAETVAAQEEPEETGAEDLEAGAAAGGPAEAPAAAAAEPEVTEAPAEEAGPVEAFVSDAPVEPAEEAELRESESPAEAPTEASVEEAQETPPAEEAPEEEGVFETQQKHFLIGKRVVRRIEGPSGEVLAEEGQIVDYEMIQAAKSSDLLLILSLNVE